MSQKIAVALVHGIGEQTEESNQIMQADLLDYVGKLCDAENFVFRVVFWAPVLEAAADQLFSRLKANARMNYLPFRQIFIDYVGDALAYQPTTFDRVVYDQIHSVFALTLRELAREAGANTPLVVVAHSLGTVLTSNYFYDLQNNARRGLVSQAVRDMMGGAPLEMGHTLTSIYTMGSPLPIWSLPYIDFGIPINVPAPELSTYYPALEGEWVNFYDPDDVLGFPLKPLNDKYDHAVKEDRAVNVGRFYESWNPLSHLGYWRDKDTMKAVAEALCRISYTING